MQSLKQAKSTKAQRILAITLLCILAQLPAKSSSLSSVRIHLSDANPVAEVPLNIEISNGDKTPITYCIDYGIKIGGELAPSPILTYMWRNRRWDLQLIGCDVTNVVSPRVLDAHQSEKYRVIFREKGRYKLVLLYADRELGGIECSGKGRKKSVSIEVDVFDK